jgi:hypothetical protein
MRAFDHIVNGDPGKRKSHFGAIPGARSGEIARLTIRTADGKD